MEQIVANIVTTDVSGFFNLKNTLIDYLINPMDFDNLLGEIRRKIAKEVPAADQTFCPVFKFKEERGAGSKRSLIITVYRKDTLLFNVPVDIIETTSAYNKKISEHLIYIGENYRSTNRKK